MNEPTRRSYFDVMKTNLKAANRTMFLTRIVYVGEYHSTPERIQEMFRKTMEHLKNEYSDSPITGFLLVYPQYLLHVLEASEELIYRHFASLLESETMGSEFGRLIPLPTYHHVNQRFFNDWYTIFTKPPMLLENLGKSGFAEIEKQATHCLAKVYQLCQYIMDCSASPVLLNDTLAHLGERVPQYILESTVIEFLLNAETSVLKDIREYMKLYRKVPTPNLYKDKVWPPTSDFVPYEVFEERAPTKDLLQSQENLE